MKILKIADGTVELGVRAFAGCTHLEEVYLPASLKRIHAECFSGCTSLKQIHVPEGTEFRFVFEPIIKQKDKTDTNTILFGVNAFCQVPWALETFGTYYVKDQVLYTCFDSAEQMTVPEGIREISRFAMKDIQVKDLLLPETLKKIDSLGLADLRCKRIQLPDELEEVGPYVFSGSDVETVIVPYNLNLHIDKDAFINTCIAFTKSKQRHMPEAYTLAAEPGGADYPEFKRFKVVERKPKWTYENRNGEKVRVYRGVIGYDGVDAMRCIAQYLRRDMLAVGVIYNSETKVVQEVRSLRWYNWEKSFMCCQAETYTDHGCIEKTFPENAGVRQLRIFSEEYADLRYGFYTSPASRGWKGEYDIVKYGDPNLHEEWFLINGHYYRYGLEEPWVLREWLKAHPGYRTL